MQFQNHRNLQDFSSFFRRASTLFPERRQVPNCTDCFPEKCRFCGYSSRRVCKIEDFLSQKSFRDSENFLKIFLSEAACPPDEDSQALLAVLNRSLCFSFSTEAAETARALHRWFVQGPGNHRLFLAKKAGFSQSFLRLLLDY